MEATQTTTPTPPTPRRPYKKREPSTKPIPDGVIYVLKSVMANLAYYGSAENIDKRMANHKSAYERFKMGKGNNRSVYEVMKQPDCKLTILERKPFNNTVELQKRESYYITTFPCVNDRSPCGVVVVKNPKTNLKEPKTEEQIYKKLYNAEYRKRPDVIKAAQEKLKNLEYRRQLYDSHNHYRQVVRDRKKKAEEAKKNLQGCLETV
jgi:hypothetical protein